MFWRMTGLSTASPVDSILDKESFTLEELLDEDDIIQECKALNTRLINFLRDKAQVEKLLRYIVEESPEDAEKKQSFKFPFIACEIFTCEIDIILRTLVEDEELMDLLFSFLKPDHTHSALLSGYFSKVVICLMLRKSTPLMNYVQGHQEIITQLVDLIGITSMMEVLLRLIGADETMYTGSSETMKWLEDTNVLDLIVDKFSSSESPEVHANAAEILCAITRYAPPALASKISSPSFVGQLFHHALEESRPKSVLVHSLSVCISLLDPKRLASASYQAYRSNLSHGTVVTASPETVDGMLSSLGDLLKLLEISADESTLPTTYGHLQPPFGKHRLKIVEFISVLLTIGSESAEKELVQQGAVKRVIDLFFEYAFNNFLHHHLENILVSCLESNKSLLTDHVLVDCKLVDKILNSEKNPTLSSDPSKPTIPTEGRAPPKIGNSGHMTRIANKLVQLSNSNSTIQTHLQENSEWSEWLTNVLLKRNEVENVYQWACGRPTSLHNAGRDSDEEDMRDRDYDVAALANNLSQAFRYGIYSNDDLEEGQGSLDRDDEDVYFDDESAEVVISSLRLSDDNDSSSLFTNSNWFAFEDDRGGSSLTSPSDNTADDAPAKVENEEQDNEEDTADEVILDQIDKVAPFSDDMETIVLGNGPTKEANGDDSITPEVASVEPEGKQVVPNGVLENETAKDDATVTSPDPVSNKKEEVADFEMEASPKVEPQMG
ncbi:Serine/threonine-protein phosphatase 6 regulatory subunit 1 [Rhynchospora pubera]|uniref:Serine/threonine-protein phosphatase 6 regulatory subunit 1 n=1 Tax=Rhynchospora pubera TaxID=906938 RepID=A0AAV8H5N9_9POAL|nr:Serine/threonine-protein phosphatase 6 regulatory subunit 1 [Rhynchospora pubera]